MVRTEDEKKKQKKSITHQIMYRIFFFSFFSISYVRAAVKQYAPDIPRLRRFSSPTPYLLLPALVTVR